jgi:predicted transcriptional regulator of viral defense system
MLSVTGRVFYVAHDLWAVVPEGYSPATTSVDPLVLPGRAREQGILAYHAALELHGHAHSTQTYYPYLLTEKHALPWTWRTYRFRPLRAPLALRQRQAEQFGVVTVERSGVSVRATSLERTFVDALARPDLGGGWAEIGRSLDTIRFLDVDAVVEYALLLDTEVTAGKVGIFLERRREALGAKEAHLSRLRAHAPKHWYSVRGVPGVAMVPVVGWNLRVPCPLARGLWGALETSPAEAGRPSGTPPRPRLRQLGECAPADHEVHRRVLLRLPGYHKAASSPVFEIGDDFLATHHVFTFHAFQTFCHERRQVSDKQINSFLGSRQASGRLLPVRRLIWAVVPEGYPPQDAPVDPLLVAAYATEDACLVQHAALAVHGYARSAPDYLTYVTDLFTGCRWYFRAHTFVPLRSFHALARRGAERTGTMVLERAGLPVRVTTVERTLVDVLMRPQWTGGWEEAWRTLSTIQSLDVDEVIRYISLLGNASTASKVGFFLESHQDQMGLSDGDLERLRQYAPRYPSPTAGIPKDQLVFVPRWNLSLPEPAVHGQWG